jgi:hypothetical protein
MVVAASRVLVTVNMERVSRADPQSEVTPTFSAERSSGRVYWTRLRIRGGVVRGVERLV